MPGSLILCATPIGNLDDVSHRLIDSLRSADVIYAEDTRRTGKLLKHLAINTPMRSFFVGNERDRAQELSDRLGSGETVALVTDAGTPGIADPGVSAVRVAVDAGAAVSVIPGASAVTAALAISGMNADRFVFEGFLPRKKSTRTAVLETLATEPRTSVVFVAPTRAGSELEEMAGVLGSERSVVVARELTKLHEEVWRGTLQQAAEHFREIRGELTVVIAGAPVALESMEDAVAGVQQLVADGVSYSEAVRRIAEERGIGRGRLYNAAR